MYYTVVLLGLKADVISRMMVLSAHISLFYKIYVIIYDAFGL